VGPPLRSTFARLLATDDAARIEQAIGHYRERFGELGWRENVAYPGIDAMLAQLHASGARLFVCTAKPERYAQRIVSHFGFDSRFVRVYGSDLDGRYEDKALLLAHVIDRERFDPARAVMIGDREHDVRAARANGLRSVGVLWGYGCAEELAHADAHAATPEALPAVLYAQSSA
jgi:phosphoglycolate phosphatase